MYQFFSKCQISIKNEEILHTAKRSEKILATTTLTVNPSAQNYPCVHKKLLYSIHSYLNLSEVEKIDTFIGEFSFDDMQLLSDKLDEINEFDVNASSCYELTLNLI